jgi:serine/threonine protein kinase
VEKEVLAAFDAIHALNVVHGDVRPENILVTEDENKVWIIDFEDGQIIDDGDDERESKVSDEMEAVCEMLQDIKKGPSSSGCLPLPESEIPTSGVSSLEVC